MTGDVTHQRRLALVLAALVALSLIAFDPGGWAIFGPVKWATVLTLAAVVAVVLPRRLKVHRVASALWIVFIGWGSLISLVAVDPIYTWIGTPDRHLGLLAWVVFFLLFVAGQQVTTGSVVVILRAATVGLLSIGLYAVAEWVDAAPVDLNLNTDRFGGPFGSAAYLGAACVLLIPVVVGAALDDSESGPWRLVAVLAAMLGMVAIIGSQTRAAWIGLAVAVAVALPALWSRLGVRRWVPVAVAVVGIVVLIISPAGGRARAVFDGDDPATRGRVDEWRIAVSLVVSRPITGAGFEGHRIVFPEEVDAEYEQRYGRQVTPDRAHNGALDVGVTAGLPGMLLYLTGLALLARSGWVVIRSGRPWLVGIAAGVIGYIVQQQFLFPLAEVDPTFWVLAGVLVAANAEGRLLRMSIPRAVPAVASLLAVVFLVVGVLDVMADRSVRTALSSDVLVEAEAATSRATSLRPDSIRYWVVFGAVVAGTGGDEELLIAIERIDRALRISPEDPILRSRKAEYLLERARLSGADSDVGAALSAWSDLVAYDPNNAQYQLQLGVAAVVARDAETAESAWLQAEWLSPSSTAATVNLATLYLAGGQLDAARDAVERGFLIEPNSQVLLDLKSRIDPVVVP